MGEKLLLEERINTTHTHTKHRYSTVTMIYGQLNEVIRRNMPQAHATMEFEP